MINILLWALLIVVGVPTISIAILAIIIVIGYRKLEEERELKNAKTPENATDGRTP